MYQRPVCSWEYFFVYAVVQHCFFCMRCSCYCICVGEYTPRPQMFWKPAFGSVLCFELCCLHMRGSIRTWNLCGKPNQASPLRGRRIIHVSLAVAGAWTKAIAHLSKIYLTVLNRNVFLIVMPTEVVGHLACVPSEKGIETPGEADGMTSKKCLWQCWLLVTHCYLGSSVTIV